MISERSWENYQQMVLDKFPEAQYLHNRNLKYGFIDSLEFTTTLYVDTEKAHSYKMLIFSKEYLFFLCNKP